MAQRGVVCFVRCCFTLLFGALVAVELLWALSFDAGLLPRPDEALLPARPGAQEAPGVGALNWTAAAPQFLAKASRRPADGQLPPGRRMDRAVHFSFIMTFDIKCSLCFLCMFDRCSNTFI